MRVEVFTDGSSNIKGDNYESSSAVIILVDGEQVYECGTYHDGGTNSLGEVYAMKMAFDALSEIFDYNSLDDVVIISDSDYVVKSVTKWIYNWVKNGWKTTNDKDVKFSDIFGYLYDNYLNKKIRNRKIKIYHIKSHTNDLAKARRKFQARNDIDIDQEHFNHFVLYNNKVDKLANKIRFDKIYYHEKRDTEWERRNQPLQRINGKIKITRTK